MQKSSLDKAIIGRHTKVVFLDSGPQAVPAKVDTGADSSAVWASRLNVDDNGVLKFVLFAKDSPYYSGRVISKKNYSVKMVRSSNGHEQIRYSVKLRVTIEGRRILATFTLANRSRNAFAVLIGSRLLQGKFLVDVSKGVLEDVHKKKSLMLTEQSNANPKKFFEQQYMKQLKRRQER